MKGVDHKEGIVQVINRRRHYSMLRSKGVSNQGITFFSYFVKIVRISLPKSLDGFFNMSLKLIAM